MQVEASGGQKLQEHYLYVVMECARLLPLSESEPAPVHLSAFFTKNDQTFLHFPENSQRNLFITLQLWCRPSGALVLGEVLASGSASLARRSTRGYLWCRPYGTFGKLSMYLIICAVGA